MTLRSGSIESMPLRKSRAVADAVELFPALVGCNRRTECPWPLRIFPEACPHMMSFAHLSRCRRADEISSESEVLKSTGSLPVAILELAARPAFLNAEDLSLFFWDSLAIRPGGSYVPGG